MVGGCAANSYVFLCSLARAVGGLHADRADTLSMATFPLQDQPLILPSGRVVVIYNLLFLTQRDDPSMSLRVEPTFRIQYGTRIGSDQPAERAAEAAEVVAYFLGEAPAEHTMVAYAEICDTAAQAERRDPPQVTFEFRRNQNGAWQRIGEQTRVLEHPPNGR